MHDIRLNDAIGLMTLRGIDGLGPVTTGKILARFETLSDLLAASQADCKGVLNARQYAGLQVRNAVSAARDVAHREMERAQRDGVAILTTRCPGYPERLAAIPEPPMLLYVLGDLACTERSVALVGARDHTRFGEAVADRFVASLADERWTVVSGLARGLDERCHEAALLHEIPTVAVVGCGLDMIHDEWQRRLATRILEAGGALVSEQSFGTPVNDGSLIKRNRIISGVSAGTVVLEATTHGGTMKTARYALLQGRPVFAPVPPPRFADEETSQGLRLLTSGTGPELVAALGSREPFAGMMRERYPNSPVAIAIRGKEDYPMVLERLAQEAAPSHALAP